MSISKAAARREIPGYVGYLADSSGAIWSASGWRGLPPFRLCAAPDHNGYLSVRVTVGGRRRKHRHVHVLVALAFHGERTGPHCRHLNGDKADNRPENLVWGTARENCADMVAAGRYRSGERHHAAKLTTAQVAEIRSATASSQSLARAYGISMHTLWSVRTARTWRSA